MFKKAKKELKNNIFLNDKYKDLFKKDSFEKLKNEQNIFVSDQQIKTLLDTFPSDGKMKQQLMLLKKQPQIRALDLVYALLTMLLIPAYIAFTFYQDFFQKNDAGTIVSLAGAFGIYMIVSFLLVYLTSGIYTKMIGGENYQDVNNQRGFQNFCHQIRSAPSFLAVLHTILNQDKPMSKAYRERTLNENKERYNDVSLSEFNEVELKFIQVLLEELENDHFDEINNKL